MLSACGIGFPLSIGTSQLFGNREGWQCPARSSPIAGYSSFLPSRESDSPEISPLPPGLVQ
jgi:hypothetical protein